MAYFIPFSAKNAIVRVGPMGSTENSTICVAKKWQVKPKGGQGDVTNFEGLGFGMAIGLIMEATIDITDADWDANNGPYDLGNTNLNFQPQQYVSLQLYLWNNIACPHWLFANALVVEGDNPANVRETMKWSSSFYGNGQFTFPTGTFTSGPTGPNLVMG